MSVQIINGDARSLPLRDQSVNCIVTSPPFWGLRDYGVDGQIGLEQTPEAWVAELLTVFRECWRVLRDDGVMWVECGDGYAGQHGKGRGDGQWFDGGKPRQHVACDLSAPGLKPKDLIGQPWRLAFALQADGWYLRSDCIWARPNPMPESVTDRPTKAHSYVFLLTKQPRYWYDADAVREGHVMRPQRRPNGRPKVDYSGGVHPKQTHSTAARQNADVDGHPLGRNMRTVWTIPTYAFPGAHFATFPPALAERCILAGCPKGGTVLDPFSGAGTVALVAQRLGRNAVGVELSADYCRMARERIAAEQFGAKLPAPKPQAMDAGPLFGGVA